MIYNYIALSASGSFLLLSIISSLSELMLAKNSRPGRVLRSLRICMRDIGHIAFILITGAFLIIGCIVKNTDWRLLWLAVGIFFLGEIVLHWFKIISVKRSRKYSKAKNMVLPLKKLNRLGIRKMLSESEVCAESKEKSK